MKINLYFLKETILLGHLIVFYHLIAAISGIAAFTLLVALKKKYDSPIIKGYFVFLTGLSLEVLSFVLDSYIGANIGIKLSSTQLITGSIGHFADSFLLFSVPYFFNELVNPSYKKTANRFFLALMVFQLLATYTGLALVLNGFLNPIYIFDVLDWYLRFSATIPIFYSLFLLIKYPPKSLVYSREVTHGIRFMVGLTILFLPGFLMDMSWLTLQFLHISIPKGFYFTSLFYLIWNIYFGIKVLPLLYAPKPSMNTFHSFSKAHILTERERDICSLLLNGLSNKQIGKTLFIEESTVKKHIQNIFQKTRSKNRFVK